MTPFVLSLGYERRRVDELIQILVDHGVDTLLDIREAPVSRRAGFSKRPLSIRLEAVGIQYRHLFFAGNPHRHLKEDPSRCLQLYRQYLQDNPEILDKFAEECDGRSVAVLCYERLHTDCHRSVLLDAFSHSQQHLEVVRVE